MGTRPLLSGYHLWASFTLRVVFPISTGGPALRLRRDALATEIGRREGSLIVSDGIKAGFVAVWSLCQCSGGYVQGKMVGTYRHVRMSDPKLRPCGRDDTEGKHCDRKG